MSLDWIGTKDSISYYVQITVYVNDRNNSKIVKCYSFVKYICDIYGLPDSKAWEKEQVAFVNPIEKETAVSVTIDFFHSKDFLANQ